MTASREEYWPELDVEVPVGELSLSGTLARGSGSGGVVVFAHGSGSSRHSPRNRAVAARLNRAGLGTLLVDLLTEDEAADRALVFDIDLLTNRLVGAIRWLRSSTPNPPSLGIFGASTGAAAALAAAATLPDQVAAVVSRGGRPDLAMGSLPRVVAPTLFIVGGDDVAVLELNRQALAAMTCPALLEVVPGAGHLFEEPGALDDVASLASAWFKAHLGV